MEPELCLSEEHVRERVNRDSCVFQVRELDKFNVDEKNQLIGLFWEFWLRVNQEDLSKKKTYKTKEGTFCVPEIEGVLYGYIHDGHKVTVALDEGNVVAFILYKEVFPGVIAIKHGFTDYCYEKCGLIKDMINSVGVKTVIFQTKKKNEPTRILEISPTKKLIDENEHLYTWIMKWESK